MKINNPMYAAAFLLAVAAPADAVLAQSEPAASPLEQSRPLRPGPPRYVEKYSFLADQNKQTDFFDPIRYIKLGQSSWLQLGGGVRYKYDNWDNPTFGLRGVEEDGYLQQRIQAHADLHLFDGGLRAFLQLEDTQSWGKEAFSPYDESDTEIHQAFADVGLPANEQDKLSARLGRQEMAYGEQVLTTVREVPNVRLAFDGVRLSYASKNGYKLNAFALRPVTNVRLNSFNDSSTNSGEFYGLYATLPVNDMLSIDLYEMSYLRDMRTLNGTSGEEERHTVGTRLFGESNSFNYTADLIYQFGEFSDKDINAWGMSSSIGYTFGNTKWKPSVALRLDAASGDDNPNDGESNTFDPLFPANGKLYGNAGATTLSNVVVFGPRVAFSPAQKVTIAPAILALWRESEDDAAYMPGMNSIPGTADVSGKRLGTSYNLFARWTPTSNLTMDLEYQYFDVSEVIRGAGGEDIKYTSVRTSFLF